MKKILVSLMEKKTFDRRALLYHQPRKRLVSFSRNLTKEEKKNSGLSAWAIMEGKSNAILDLEAKGEIEEKHWPVYESAYTHKLISLWNYVAHKNEKKL